jgi:hypothetical protein
LTKASEFASTAQISLLQNICAPQAFICEIRRLFTEKEIRNYLDRLEHTKYLAPQEPDLEPESEEDLDEEELGLENPVMGAQELLRFSRVRELLEA